MFKQHQAHATLPLPRECTSRVRVWVLGAARPASVLDPVILFFVLGITAGLLRSELRLPAAVYELVTIVLLLAIGLKGGIELAKQPLGQLLPQMVAVVGLLGKCQASA